MRRFPDHPTAPGGRPPGRASATGEHAAEPGSPDDARSEGAHLPADAQEEDVLGLGMTLFLASITMVFGATLAGYAVVRWKNAEDWSRDLGVLEWVGLGVATVLLVGIDVAATRARRAVLEPPRACALTRTALLLACGYMLAQLVNWLGLADELLAGRGTGARGASLGMEGFAFLMLTLTHAAHVLGGIVAAALVLRGARLRGGVPRPGRMRLLARYWRFLTLVWVVLVAVLVAG